MGLDTEIILLAYADDIVLVSDSVVGLNKILRALLKYCNANHLEVNEKKTKIIIYRKGGYVHNKKLKFTYGNSTIDIVKNYTYLGIPQSQSASPEEALKNAVTAVKLATSSTVSLINIIDLNTWKPIPKLFDGLVSSTLFYAIQVWGFKSLEEIEVVQTNFFKKILLLPQNTPNYALRLEVGTVKLLSKVFKLSLNLIEKILSMKKDRLPKICLLRLIKLSKSTNTVYKYNWCLQLEKMFEFIGEKIVWNAHFIRNNKERLIKTYDNFLRAEDVISLLNSRSLQLFPSLTLREGTQSYLRLKLPLNFLKIFAQIRLLNKYNTRIIFKNKIHKFDIEYCCGARELKGRELYHVLIECDLYGDSRKKYISSFLLSSINQS